FGLLISACYLGVATRVVEKLADRDRLDPKLFSSALAEVETMRTALHAVAREFDEGARGGDVSARLALVRWSMRDALVRVQSLVREAVGGFAYMQDPELAYAFEAVPALGGHPPSRRGPWGAARGAWVRLPSGASAGPAVVHAPREPRYGGAWPVGYSSGLVPVAAGAAEVSSSSLIPGSVGASTWLSPGSIPGFSRAA